MLSSDFQDPSTRFFRCLALKQFPQRQEPNLFQGTQPDELGKIVDGNQRDCLLFPLRKSFFAVIINIIVRRGRKFPSPENPGPRRWRVGILRAYDGELPPQRRQLTPPPFLRPSSCFLASILTLYRRGMPLLSAARSAIAIPSALPFPPIGRQSHPRLVKAAHIFNSSLSELLRAS